MINIEGILENLKELKGQTYREDNNLTIDEEAYNDIICAFEDYEYEGVSEIEISDPYEFGDKKYIDVYANHADAPIIKIELIDDEFGDAWLV